MGQGRARTQSYQNDGIPGSSSVLSNIQLVINQYLVAPTDGCGGGVPIARPWLAIIAQATSGGRAMADVPANVRCGCVR